ncbi:hypothetical protein [Desulfosarcina sp.]|uniref:hypothetical protein n=1 Tax=Desulfosarcina sp. TaxID=2027861 RepID=UPI0029B8B6D4|nr:hypothetical protein [Desulfosarcina sp.]MDX2451413.1 hypothetical protein [Desulfosarcina sp.]
MPWVPLSVVGILFVLYWYFTEKTGVGDLRPYVLAQFLPMIVIPAGFLHCRLFFVADRLANRHCDRSVGFSRCTGCTAHHQRPQMTGGDAVYSASLHLALALFAVVNTPVSSAAKGAI